MTTLNDYIKANGVNTMKTMTISTFKTYALRVLDQISKTHEKIVITKRGKPIVEIIPFYSLKEKPIPGKLSQTLVSEKDIISPLGENLWEVCK